jgi:ubiquinone/menaquinone biosynthesis C-methylase UbiE
LNENAKKNSVFDLIAPIYGLFYNYQKKHYHEALDEVQKELDFSGYKEIIDVGCGTGALCSVLDQRGFSVTGVDPAQKMLNIAMGKEENRAIEFIRANALERLPFEDKSFDVSIASYVAHGLKGYERKTMYAEMSRITRHRVIIYDYNEKRSVLTDTIEWLEGGDYFNFIKEARSEMRDNFCDVHIINVDLRAAWYIGVPKA